MGDIFAVGETTFDIIFRNGQPAGAVVGGSMVNTAVTLGRLGLPVSLISRMGNDKIGDLSSNFLKHNGVGCDFVTRFDGNSRLSLAFLDNENNAEYQFYKSEKVPSLKFPELNASDIIIFGSTNAIRDEGRDDLLVFLKRARNKNILTIYDPNIRESGTSEMIDVRKKFEENLCFTKVLKGSDQDFMRLYGTDDADEVFTRVLAFGVEVLVVTCGSKPVELRAKNVSFSFSVDQVIPVSTIGAGDNFTSGLVFGFVRESVSSQTIGTISAGIWKKIISCSNSFAAEVCKSESNYVSTEFASTFLF